MGVADLGRNFPLTSKMLIRWGEIFFRISLIVGEFFTDPNQNVRETGRDILWGVADLERNIPLDTRMLIRWGDIFSIGCRRCN